MLLENAPGDAAITAAGLEAQAAQRGVIAARLVQDGYTPERAERLAVLAVAALDGALLQARVSRSGAPLLTAAEEFGRLLRP